VDTNDSEAISWQKIAFPTSIMASQVISEPADKLATALRSGECTDTSFHKDCHPQFWSNFKKIK